MEQKQVKIIGLKVIERFGILQSFECKFDDAKNLIVIKGEVGSGKTTFQKSLSIGTLGSETLKNDKALYGDINQEVQLLDGDTPIFVGCKSNDKGALTYIIYTKNTEGKIVKDPVVDGIKLTPSVYLKSLQTALTWRMDELTSENPTVQKHLLLELYKTDLAKIGVIFDKKDEGYVDSILGRIESAEGDRAQKDYQRKQVGGFAKHLQPMGIDVSNPDTFPKRQNVEQLEKEKNKFAYDLENVNSGKQQKLEGIKVKVEGVYVKLRAADEDIKSQNKELEAEFDEKQRKYTDAKMFKEKAEGNLVAVKNNDALNEAGLQYLLEMINDTVKLAEPPRFQAKDLIPFNEDGKCMVTEFGENVAVNNLLIELKGYKDSYKAIEEEKDKESGEKIQVEIDLKEENITLAKENNKKCDAIDSFHAWQDADAKVVDLKAEYAQLLKSINTGVEGLKIAFTEVEGKLDIYLVYNGEYDPGYFNNKEKEYRKLSSYSGTQKPLICLLLQNYLLSKKPKAMRYLWIDNVPIDAKTKALLKKMGEELDLCIFVNITGDFNRGELDSGDILIEGGEIFFN